MIVRASWFPHAFRLTRRAFIAAMLTMAMSTCLPPASAAEATPAQSYPSRPVRIITGQQPGTPSDVIARLFGENLSKLSGQAVVIENHPGAGGTIGAELAAKAAADGYTLLVAGHSNLVLAMAAGVDRRYDAMEDFAPIGRIASVPFALAVNRKVPVNSVQDLVVYARAHPGQLTYATNGKATMSQLGIDLLRSATGIKMLAVPYSGAGTALADVVAGRVDMMFTDYAVLAPHVASGALRVLGSGGELRAAAALDVPTIAEQGFDGFAVNTWYGLVAPIGIPSDTLARLAGLVAEIRRLPDMRRSLERLGYEPLDDSPTQFGVTLRSEIEKYSEVLRKAALRED